MSIKEPNFSWVLFVFMLLTATGFQIISNFANDYGDGVKGTDNDNRLGPKRVLQSGLLSKEELKQGIFFEFTSVFCLGTFLNNLCFWNRFMVVHISIYKFYFFEYLGGYTLYRR